MAACAGDLRRRYPSLGIANEVHPSNLMALPFTCLIAVAVASCRSDGAGILEISRDSGFRRRQGLFQQETEGDRMVSRPTIR